MADSQLKARLGLLLLLAAGFPASLVSAVEPQRMVEIRIALEPRSPARKALKGFVMVRPESRKSEEVRVPVTGLMLVVKAPAATSWDVIAEVPGYWTPERILNPPRPGESWAELHLSLWPTGRLSGALKMQDPKAPYPADLTVRVEPPPAARPSQERPRALLPCPVDARGSWTCEVPAGLLDLGFRAKGFVPQYRWGLNVPPGETLPLGILELRHGASLAGWVAVEEGAIAPGQCTASLTPLSGPGEDPSQTRTRLRRTANEGLVGKDGFFQIGGVAPGTYQLEVRQPGFAPAKAFPLEVWDRSETMLKQPLILKRPLALELSISPPLDWLGRPWSVFVQRRSDFSAGVEGEPAFHGQADLQGRVRIPDQSPGLFVVDVADSLGNRLLHERALEIDGSDAARQTLEIDLVDVHGQVTLAKEPLAATLWFGGQSAALHVKMESDQDGKFRGVLPRSGSWRVEVIASEPRIESHLKVDVAANYRKVANLKLVIPDTRIFGKVVDEAGHPVEAAEVSLDDLAGIDTVQTDESGHFELRGAPEGRATLSAQHASREGPLISDTVILTVAEGNPTGPLDLVLRRMKTLQGKILSPRGPVPGAIVRVSPLSLLAGRAEQTRTGIDGTFSVRVDARAQPLMAVVSPPGQSLKAFQISAATDPVNLEVSEEGGNLDVALPFALREATDRLVTVFQNGLPLPLSTLVFWTEGHGQPFADGTALRIPNLATGNYEVCVIKPVLADEDTSFDSLKRQGHCATGSLANGSTLRLDLKKD